jgi:DNA-binding NtrC family response regulator/predicted hydrocarbon binding protein
MRLTVNQESLLDRGGNPTIREFLSKLTYNPVDGTIKLNERRLIMQRATTRGALRDELIRQHGRDDAFVILTRLGYLAGQEDAEFIRQAWPALDQGDAFTAGTRLHMLKGEVRVETVHNDFDFKKGKFSGEFFWNDSVEATEYLDRHDTAHESMCWTQVGYAAGYASYFFGKLIVFKEVQCIARGDKRCRVVGRPAEAWDSDDETVRLYRRHILAEGRPSALQPQTMRTTTLQQDVEGGGHHAEDPVAAILLEPVRQRLEQIAQMADIPVLITGPCGSGKCMAARHIHNATHGAAAPFARFSCSEIADSNLADMIAVQQRRGRKPAREEEAATTIVLEDIERLGEAIQRQIAGMLSDGKMGTGERRHPRLIATSTLSPHELSGLPHLRKDLLYPFMALPVAMPALASRPQDIARLADAIMGRLALGYRKAAPALAKDAAAWLATLPLPANLLELEALMRGAILTAHQNPVTASALEIVAQSVGMLRQSPGPHEDLTAVLEQAIERGGFAIDDLNRQIYQMTIRRAEGNVAQAARMLGLSRAQFAYRLGQINTATSG